MAAASPANIRNIGVCGHSTCGKTTLVDALLLKAGAIPRQGNIGDGSTVCDFDSEEKERQHSIDLACAYFEYEVSRET